MYCVRAYLYSQLKARPGGLRHETESPLAISLKLKKMDLARLLVEKGAPVDGKFTDNPKPLTLCSQDYNFVIDLVKRGAKPRDIQRNERETHFHAAMRYGFANQGKDITRRSVFLCFTHSVTSYS